VHFPSIFLFNAAVLNLLLALIFAVLTRQFWQDLKQQPSRATWALTIFFGGQAVAHGWSAVYIAVVLAGLDSYPVEAVVLLVRDLALTFLLASTVYLIVELKYGNHK